MVVHLIHRLRCYYWALNRCQLVSAVRNSRFQALPYFSYGGRNLRNTIKTIIGWDLASSLRILTTENASDMTAGIKRLREQLKALSPGQYQKVEGSHVRCLAHIINLAVESFMGEAHEKIKKEEIACIAYDSKCEKKGFSLQVQKGTRCRVSTAQRLRRDKVEFNFYYS